MPHLLANMQLSLDIIPIKTNKIASKHLEHISKASRTNAEGSGDAKINKTAIIV